MPRSSRKRFAVCVDNTDYLASLELHELYQVLSDPEAEDDGELRIIDESGEDYLYEADRLLELEFPPQTARVLNRSFARIEPAGQ